ncbi:YecA family protein [Legionella maioricensis]|uniref:SEC-C domain-containing protein n=1 Tax=Legionella maioricensis TaxID=2896528 RepID=A0A9X2D1E2_9GAMM|nr:SEC-C metal-binding domain-containing protein [Legionella maioricensis]MCL9684393.1 SEC-C domain-containing protein [Legionella maioricensis]MCL9687574.1 SEC-C domain-containing protein [Legionella maioricensis]
MTLILTAGTNNYVIQISDRKITAKGKFISDKTNKSLILLCDDGRFIVGFTGLAQFPSSKEINPITKKAGFYMQDWLINTLHDIGQQENAIFSIAEQLKNKLSVLYENPSFSRQRLTVVFSGFIDNVSPSLWGSLFISNFQRGYQGECINEAEEFQIFQVCSNKEVGSRFVTSFGDTQHIKPNDIEFLSDLVGNKDINMSIIKDGIEKRFRAIAHRSNRTIGENLNLVFLYNDPHSEPTVEFSGADSSKKAPYSSIIDLRQKKAPFTIAHPTISLTEGEFPKKIFQVNRNKPCPCRSGLKYKRCHGQKKKTKNNY